MGELKQAKSKTRVGPRGRTASADALKDITALLGDAPRCRDLLIEHLHKIQGRFGGISKDHMAALANLMNMAQAEVYEVATFYHHFTVIPDGVDFSGKTIVRVCQNAACHMRNSSQLLADLEQTLDGRARVVAGPCMGACDKAPAVSIGEAQLGNANADNVAEALKQGQTKAETPETASFSDYPLWRSCLDGQHSRDQIIDQIEEAGLRGLGGAGFPTARKWRFVRAEEGPRYLVVNADEGEPGTFKDRYCFETSPSQVLEGTLIAAWAIEASAIYIYLRGEYPGIHLLLEKKISRLTEMDLLGGMEIHLRRGAGAYICGEESALLESLEGKRGIPRHKPPFPAQSGLFGQPTAINNVETLYWIPAILNGTWSGQRLYSVSGRVKNPGVKEAKGGISVRQLIDTHCGGMEKGHRFTAFLPGGASGGILPASLGDTPLDFGSLDEYGCFVGSAAVVVLSDQDDPRDIALNMMAFFEDESCGQCTPCRLGTAKAATLMKAGKWDESLLKELAEVMSDASICGLGQAAPNPLRSVMRFFPEGGE